MVQVIVVDIAAVFCPAFKYIISHGMEFPSLSSVCASLPRAHGERLEHGAP